MTNEKLGQLSINTIRTLSIDAAQQAKSSHRGTPMALARRSIRSGTAQAVH
jgi:transketolase